MNIEKLTPAFKDYLWGGTKLRDVYGKKCNFEKVAESWELSTHPAGESRILGGKYDELPFSQYIERAGKAVLGENGKAFENFPVLIKFIDAKVPLSIQVHPSDEYALEVEHEYGKTEMWIVMDCDPGASLYFGVNRPVSKEEFRRRIEDNTVLEVLNRVDVHPGDVFFIEAGTIHAIGGGILICEIQQNSNTTYRVYDYARKGPDGQQRELHVDKALEVSCFAPSDTADKRKEAVDVAGGTVQRLARCKYFTVDEYRVQGTIHLEATEQSFVSLIFIKGEGRVQGPENILDCKAGDSLFVPAGAGAFTLSGDCTVIGTTV